MSGINLPAKQPESKSVLPAPQGGAAIEVAAAQEVPRVPPQSPLPAAARVDDERRVAVLKARDIVVQKWKVLDAKANSGEPLDEHERYNLHDSARCVQMLHEIYRGDPCWQILADDQDDAALSYAQAADPHVAGVFDSYLENVDWEAASRQALDFLESRRPLGMSDFAPPRLHSLDVHSQHHVLRVKKGETKGCEVVDGLFLGVSDLAEAICSPVAAGRLVRTAEVMRGMKLVERNPGHDRPLAPLLFEALRDRAETILEPLERHRAARPQFTEALGATRDAMSSRDPVRLRNSIDLLATHSQSTFRNMPNGSKNLDMACEYLTRALVCLERMTPAPRQPLAVEPAVGAKRKRGEEDHP